METLLYSLTVNGLPHLLRYGDRNAMRFSIENRVPFATLPLAEFMLSLPERYLVSCNGETKSVFKTAMRGLVPDQILDRRDKVGFDTPMREWMSGHILNDIQTQEADVNDGLNLTHRSAIEAHIKSEFAHKHPLNWQVWRIYNLLKWQRQSAYM
jgi:asparagine synthase (glutamine-hydrolysing)